MPFLGSKYAKIVFPAGTLPRTPLGELTALPRPPSWIKGPTSKGRGGKRRGVKGKGEEGMAGEGRTGESCAPFLKFLDPPC